MCLQANTQKITHHCKTKSFSSALRILNNNKEKPNTRDINKEKSVILQLPTFNTKRKKMEKIVFTIIIKIHNIMVYKISCQVLVEIYALL